MPVMDCVKDGKPGKKYGVGGVCYTGPDAEEKAKRQGRAIERAKELRRRKRNEKQTNGRSGGVG